MASKIFKKRYEGNIALTTVLVLMAILVISGTTMLMGSLDMARIANDYRDTKTLELYASSCLEEGLRKLSIDTGYTGSFEFDQNDLACDIAIATETGNPSVKIISISATVKNFYYFTSARVNITTNPISVL